MESVENEIDVFHPSHRAWKTRQTTPEFSTVPTASAADLIRKKRKEMLAEDHKSALDFEHSLPYFPAPKGTPPFLKLAGTH